ncbi:hypothetical protein DFP72DRAFT_840830 [Ephemerocybe angulata]|uniref:Uncharacterized protein n=1 Tax=Ephemerocybe angulata TaxID=980116 RepID=A0A8H6IG35_9AGAR|nr:hypothetical protein DFP72DRAFT_840830 [Tulosesus angulatus]
MASKLGFLGSALFFCGSLFELGKDNPKYFVEERDEGIIMGSIRGHVPGVHFGTMVHVHLDISYTCGPSQNMWYTKRLKLPKLAIPVASSGTGTDGTRFGQWVWRNLRRWIRLDEEYDGRLGGVWSERSGPNDGEGRRRGRLRARHGRLHKSANS